MSCSTNCERRGVLDRTVVIITADHGEELGDHGLFEHGESLYRPEIHVPLLVLLPSRGHSATCGAGDRQPPRFAGDDRRSGRPGGRSTVPGPVAGQVVGRFASLEPPSALVILMERSPSFRNRIRPIPVEVDRPPLEVRSSPWPRRTMFTSATRGTGKSSCFTSATIRSSSSIVPRTKRCSPSSSGSASVSIR